MGYCHEFGSQICEGCGEPMLAAHASCVCDACGTECRGRFPGCAAVWARGPRASDAAPAAARPTRAAPTGSDRSRGRAIGLAPNHPVLSLDPDARFVRSELGRLRDELGRISRALQRHHGTVTELVGRQAAAERITELARVLPDRLGAAIAAAIETRQDAYLGELDAVTERLASCLTQVAAAADALREESVRLRRDGAGPADELGEAAIAIEGTAARVVRRIAELAPPLAPAAEAATVPPGPRRSARTARGTGPPRRQ